MKIIDDFKNELLKRQEIKISLEAEKTPSFEEARKIISEHFKKAEEVIEILGIKGSFGSNEFKIEAFIYDSKEDLEKAKQLTKKQRKELEKKEESEKVEEGKSEEKPEEGKSEPENIEGNSEGSKEGEAKSEEKNTDENKTEENKSSQ